MMKSGAPPNKVGVLHHLLPVEFHGSTGRIDYQGVITLWFLKNLEKVWVPLT